MGEGPNIPTSMRGTVGCGANQAATTTPMNPRPETNGGDVVGVRLRDQRVKPTGSTGQARHHVHPERSGTHHQFGGSIMAWSMGEVHAARQVRPDESGTQLHRCESPMYRYGRTDTQCPRTTSSPDLDLAQSCGDPTGLAFGISPIGFAPSASAYVAPHGPWKLYYHHSTSPSRCPDATPRPFGMIHPCRGPGQALRWVGSGRLHWTNPYPEPGGPSPRSEGPGASLDDTERGHHPF